MPAPSQCSTALGTVLVFIGVPAVAGLFLLWTFFAGENGEQGEVFVAVHVPVHMYC